MNQTLAFASRSRISRHRLGRSRSRNIRLTLASKSLRSSEACSAQKARAVSISVAESFLNTRPSHGWSRRDSSFSERVCIIQVLYRDGALKGNNSALLTYRKLAQ